jgi:hypothetical protein
MISLDPNDLKIIESELNAYKDLSKVEIFNTFINKRLAATLIKYNEQIDATSEYLLRQSSVRVLKALTKIKKVDDKDIIQQYRESEND